MWYLVIYCRGEVDISGDGESGRGDYADVHPVNKCLTFLIGVNCFCFCFYVLKVLCI